MASKGDSIKLAGYAITGFLAGSCLLIVCSLIQKIVAGFNPLVLRGYIVPFLFGGIAGLLLALNFLKINKLNTVLGLKAHELEKFLPTCSRCKKIREVDKDPKDKSSWHPIENYISARTSSQFTHSICPECIEEQYPADIVQKLLPGLHKTQE